MENILKNQLGLFITFEGIDGSGKTTQIGLLNEYLNKKGFRTILTKEPGGTLEGDLIRKILAMPDLNLTPTTEWLLFLASRTQHLAKRILPALKEKKIVLCDRFIHSTIAYQAGGNQMCERVIEVLTKAFCAKKPDLTFFIDIPIYEMRLRIKKRNEQLHRIEREGVDFFKRTREMYLKQAKNKENNIIVIDGKKTKRAIQAEIRRILMKKFLKERKK